MKLTAKQLKRFEDNGMPEARAKLIAAWQDDCITHAGRQKVAAE